MFHSERERRCLRGDGLCSRFVDTKMGHGAGRKGLGEVGGGWERIRGGYCFFCFGFVTNRRYICIRIDVRKLNKKTWNMLENSNQDMCVF